MRPPTTDEPPVRTRSWSERGIPNVRPPVHWPLSALVELDPAGRVLRFQGHDPASYHQAHLLLGQDLFEVLGRSFDTRRIAERYRALAGHTGASRFADAYPILVEGSLHCVQMVFSVVPRFGRGCVSIRTSGTGELLRMAREA